MSMNRKVTRGGLSEQRTAYLFIAPFVAGFLFFQLVPMASAFLVSLLDMNSLKALSNLDQLEFDGFGNFARFFTDDLAMAGFLKSFQYTLVYVPALIGLSLLLAAALNRSFRLRNPIRTMMFMPYVSNIMAIAIVMAVIFEPFDGPINALLRMLGWERPPMWMAGLHTVIPTVAVIAAWHGMAFYIIVYLVALRNVPKDLYEAAEIDGAGRVARFVRVTLPLISPTTFMLVITAIINSFQNFAVIKTMTGGGPGNASRVAAINIYDEAFAYGRYSYATAQAVLLFAIILLITVIQWRGQKRWVHY